MSNKNKWDDLRPELRAHLGKIREALNEGRAAAMIGAGFSRNAINGHRMPTWTELGRKLAPDASEVSAADVPRLAELYKALHGGEALYRLIKDSIPDKGVTEPSDLHTRLLCLNWKEVFTTNYDTLLERAYFEDQDSEDPKILNRYHIVHTAQDIPASQAHFKRRIVKLHGSFPSYEPLIVSEEDYRTYPQQFSPFVNTVRQSMLENVFCLIGFSGDDPNFLAWIGWVRDQLAQHQPRIYLILVSELSLGQRELLLSRNIVCVDIRELDKTGGADYASWYTLLLEFLKEEYMDPQDWRYVDPELWVSGFPNEPSEDEYARLFRAMRQARRSYPGWVFPPLDSVRELWRFAENNGVLFRKRASPRDTTSVLADMLTQHEILWMAWTAGLPCEKSFIRRSVALLKLCFPILFKDKNCKLRPSDSWIVEDVAEAEIMEAWQQSVCMLLSFCRQDWWSYLFSSCQSLLQSVPPKDLQPDSSNWLSYQSILLHLDRLELETAREKLHKWLPVSSESPFWPVRRAMLTAELDDSKQAQFQIREALRSIRRRIQIDGETPELLSYEQWAACYKQMLNVMEQTEIDSVHASVANERFKRVCKMPWHPHTIIYAVHNTIFNALYAPETTKTSIGFDLGNRTDQIKLQNGSLPGFARALTFLALIERVALAPGMRDRAIEFHSNIRVNTATQLFQLARGVTPQCLGLANRSASLVFMKPECLIFSRTGIAMLPTDMVLLLTERCYALLQSYVESFPLPKQDILGQRHDVPPFIGFALELLGRLSARSSEADYPKLLDTVISWYTAPAFNEAPSLYDFFGKFFKRVVENAPYGVLAENLTHLFALPIITEAQRPFQNRFWRNWVDPVEALPQSWLEGLRQILPPASWDNVAQQLLIDLGTEPVTPDTLQIVIRYWQRLSWLRDNALLSTETLAAVWEFIQKDKHNESWAKIPGCADWVPLLWAPANEIEGVWQNYCTYMLQKFETNPSVEEMYWLFCLTPELRRKWVETDNELLIVLLESMRSFMATVQVAPQKDPLGLYLRETRNCTLALWLLCFIGGQRLALLVERLPWLPEALQNFRQTCCNMDEPHLRLELLLASMDTDFDREDIIRRIERALHTAQDGAAYEAGITVLTWHAYFSNITPLPPISLLSKAFELRRPFNQKLCKLLIERQSYLEMPFSDEELKHLLPALKEYAEALRYTTAYPDRSQNGILEQGAPFPWELPEERRQCAELVAILWKQSTVRSDPAMQLWVNEMRNDPLAELRNRATSIDALKD